MQNFEEHLRDDSWLEGDRSLSPNPSSALRSLRFRLGLGNSPSLENQRESQEDALRNLSHRDWTIRVEAIGILGASGKQEFTRLLIGLLQDENVAVREAVAKAFGELGGESSVEPLISCLKDEEWSIRATALQSLGKLGEFVPIEPLVAGLQDEDVSVRLVAVRALEKQAKRVPLEVFITALGDQDDLVCGTVIQVVERLLEHPEQCVLTDTLMSVLVEKVESKNEDVRLAASRFLGRVTFLALTEGIHTVQGEKFQLVWREMPRESEERGHQHLKETLWYVPTLYLGSTGEVIHPRTMKRNVSITSTSCTWKSKDCSSRLWEVMGTRDDLLYGVAGSFLRRTRCEPLSDAQLNLGEQMIYVQCKNSFHHSKCEKHVVGSISVSPVILHYAISSFDNLKHLVWPISEGFEQSSVIELLVLLLEASKNGARYPQLVELLHYWQKGEQTLLRLPTGTNLFSLEDIKEELLRNFGEASTTKEYIMRPVSNEEDRDKVPLYTPRGEYQVSMPVLQ